jgi:signal recognition particle receptor subunit beta
MVLFNYSTKELTAKIVYYGPGLCGKTTNLQFVHQNLPDNVRGKMLSLATKTDRTLFFDFLPIDLGEIRGMKTRVQLYTVPGQVFYNETRKLVLKGADGIVFVADSQKQMLRANTESFKNLEENLKAHGMTLADMPHVIQFNKRDLPKLSSIEEMNAEVNKYNAPFYESVATTGIGVQDTLKGITKLVLLHLTKKYEAKPASGVSEELRPAPRPAPTPAAIPLAAAPRPVAAPPPMPPGAPPSLEREETELRFDDEDIDDLVGDVEEETPEFEEPAAQVEPLAAAPRPSAARGVAFEIDRKADPEWIGEPPAAGGGGVGALQAVPSASVRSRASIADTVLTGIPALSDEAADGPESTVRLTDVVEDRELFDDPDLAVATMAADEEQEIVIPVEVAGDRGATRRFMLPIRLRLHPVD